MQNLADALKNSEVLFDRAQLEQAIARVALEINRDYVEERPVFLTVMHGGMIFASLLSLELDFDVDFDYLHATRYRGATTGSGLDFNEQGRNLPGLYALVG